MRSALVFAAGLLAAATAIAEPVRVLFVGNSYTFGRVDPVMSYNAANVTDLTRPVPGTSFTNTTGSNPFEPHPWGGVPGIFKQLTVQAGLDYDVSLSARNAATLRGHYYNTNPADWDLRGNIASRSWDQVVLQEQSDEPLTRRNGLASNPTGFRTYVDAIEDYIHQGAASPPGFRERDLFPGSTSAERQANCVASGYSSGNCSAQRTVTANANANAGADVFLYQTWARPNLVDGAFVTTTDPNTGVVTRTGTPATTFFSDLEAMTGELKLSFEAAQDQADNDGSAGIAGIAPVGEAFLRAVTSGVATRNMWSDDALSDDLIDLWFDDGTHASKWGSYLSALTLFGTLTGLDPAMFGGSEIAARELGISAAEARWLQRVASDQLGFVAVSAPPTWGLLPLAGLAVALRRRRG